ncbi:unnamed protein product [Penicillium camemberti]|uniref:Str. FM013 n=1 Tax=Penicillium camemberti (strain FM 013) TaxID=1429867 RepID=A0A0G4PLV6_PENC3|nr:unnamed protein product [Penicillium camemberti]
MSNGMEGDYIDEDNSPLIFPLLESNTKLPSISVFEYREGKGSVDGRWIGKVSYVELEIKNLPCQLESISVNELLQNTIFTRATYKGELKLLVSIANKTAYHGIKSYYVRC